MSLENKKENNNVNSLEGNDRYVKNDSDHNSHGHEKKIVEKCNDDGKCDDLNDFDEFDCLDVDCIDLLDDFCLEDSNTRIDDENFDGSEDLIHFPQPFVEDNLNELAMLGFFNNFTLMDIGIHDLIREIYFED